MPSGKRARQQRQAAAAAVKTPPPVRSKGVGGIRPRQASPRALTIAGGVVLVAVIAIVLGVALGHHGGGGGGGRGSVVSASDIKGLPRIGSDTNPVSLPGAQEANNLFKGIPQQGLVLGKPSAPVEMEMFIDVQCPICRDYEVNDLSTVVNKYIRTGKAQLHLQPWAFLGSQSFTGRLGVIAASLQSKSKGYEYTKVLYDNQGQEESGWLTGQQMAVIAASVNGLNMRQWLSDVNGSGVKQIASKVDKLASKDNVQGTPTIFVGCPGGKLQDVTSPGLAPTLQQTEQAINAATKTCSK
jgi:protein-disulfide isomerase